MKNHFDLLEQKSLYVADRLLFLKIEAWVVPVPPELSGTSGEDVLVGVLESVFRPSQSKNILQVRLLHG